MDTAGQVRRQKPATAARMYDYYLGGIHNFPADREAADRVMERFPTFPMIARENRKFLRRAVRFLVDAGVRQFLDIGSGIPTEGNVHEIAQQAAPDSRVVYVDTDPVAVAESLELLEHNELATAIRGDLREPRAILDHPRLTKLLDFEQPVGLLLAAVLHFVSDDAEAYDCVGQLVDVLPKGSYLVISAAAAESFAPADKQTQAVIDVYRQRTTTSAASRNHDEIQRFFGDLEMVKPGLVWLHQWPDPTVTSDFDDDPSRSGEWAGVGVKR